MHRVVLLAFIWGWSFLFIKVAGEGMTPPTVAGIRVGLGAAVVLAVLRLRGVALPRDRATWRAFAVTAVFASVLPFTALAWGEERISSALASVLNASTPLFTAGLAAIVDRERLRPLQLAGLAMGIVGVAVAAGLGPGDLEGSTITGSLAPLFAALCYGIGFIYVNRRLLHVPPSVAAAGQLTVATVLLAPVAVGTSITGGFDPTVTRVASVVLLGVFGTGVAMVGYYRVVSDLGPTRASLVTYLVPVVAVAVGVLVLDERFTIGLLAGGLLVVASVAAVHGKLRLPVRLPLRPASAPVILVALLAVGPLLLAACGSDDGGGNAGDGAAAGAGAGAGDTTTSQVVEAVCGDVVTEPVHPASTQHVLPGTAEPTYATDPPTSGPHDSRPLDPAVQSEPIPRPRQVGQLEAGKVLVQHRDLTPDARAAVEALAGEQVIVGPNPELPAQVVVTAWVTKMECSGVDVQAIEAFVDAHAGVGPGGH